MPSVLPSEAITIPIIDIRRHEIDSVSIADIVNGVTSNPRYMPSLLLYDTQGLQHFTSITEAKDYYPTKSEVEILEKQAPEIVGSAAANSFFIELGAGYVFLLSFPHLHWPALRSDWGR